MACVLALLPGSLMALRSVAAPPENVDARSDQEATEPGLRAALEADPTNLELRVELGTLLSHQQGRLDEAIAQYQDALAIDPENRSARHGLARANAWSGRSMKAISEYDALLSDDPSDEEAHFGRGQLARWNGDRARARLHLRRAIELDPNKGHYYEELGRVEVDARSFGAAQDMADLARLHGTNPTVLDQALAAATKPKLRLKTSFSDETNDFQRANGNIRAEFRPWPDTLLRFATGYTRFQDDTGDIDRFTLLGAVKQSLPRDLVLSARYAFRKPLDVDATHEFGAELSGRPIPLPIELRLGVSRQSMVDRRPEFEDIEPLEGVGSGGNTLDAILDRRQITEVYGGLSGNPIPGTYAYADYSGGWINDGNDRQNATAGFGLDLVQLLTGASAHAVTLKYDFFYLDYDREDPDYFSPEDFMVHTPGLAWRWWPTDRLVLGLEAGLPLEPGESPGWQAGAFSRIELGQSLFLGLRARHLENPSYRITTATLGFEFGF
jgi:tetratricopeptide (TPR) repeat protein